jgi:hypothetical protein
MWFVVKGWLGSDDPAVLDHALHAHNTRVDRGNPAIAVLSIGHQSLGSCPAQRAGGVLGMFSSLEVKVLYPT